MTQSVEHAPIGVIIVSHEKYGAALLQAAESILGQQNDCVFITVDVAHNVDEAVFRLTDAAERLNGGEGVIVLTDMFGGTPTNLALALLKNYNAEVVTGVNLPMLLKVFEMRSSVQLEELAKQAGMAGKAGIVVASTMLKNKTRDKSEN